MTKEEFEFSVDLKKVMLQESFSFCEECDDYINNYQHPYLLNPNHLCGDCYDRLEMDYVCD